MLACRTGVLWSGVVSCRRVSCRAAEAVRFFQSMISCNRAARASVCPPGRVRLRLGQLQSCPHCVAACVTIPFQRAGHFGARQLAANRTTLPQTHCNAMKGPLMPCHALTNPPAQGVWYALLAELRASLSPAIDSGLSGDNTRATLSRQTRAIRAAQLALLFNRRGVRLAPAVPSLLSHTSLHTHTRLLEASSLQRRELHYLKCRVYG
jgi:hypothetical protein